MSTQRIMRRGFRVSETVCLAPPHWLCRFSITMTFSANAWSLTLRTEKITFCPSSRTRRFITSDEMKGTLEPSRPSIIPNPCTSIFFTIPVIVSVQNLYVVELTVALSPPSTLAASQPLRVVGGQHRSSPHGEVFVVSADLGELPHHGRIEPAVLGFGIESLQGFFGRESSPVRAIGSQCIVDVRDLQNSRFQRNGFSAKAIRIPTPVHFFMMMSDHRQDSAKRLERRADFFSNNRMLLHDSSFFRVQRTGFKKNAFWHVNFSNVVEPTGDAEFVQVVVSQTEAFSQLLCICHQTLRVAIPQVLFRVHAARQRKHCGLRLLIHVFLESQERLNASEEIPER